jgi:DNA-binding response OmpR family regulator
MKERILLIEDEIELQQNLKEILEYHGFIVVTADNGIEAVSLIKDQEVDLVLCDIMMPEMDGFQFLKIFRSNERNQQAPFIFLSAKVREEDKSKGLEEGADDYLTKPISARLLLNAIFGALDRKKETLTSAFSKIEDELGIDYFPLLSETLTPVSRLLNVLKKLKTTTGSIDQKEISQLVSLAFTSAQWMHSSFAKLPLIKSLEKSSAIPGSLNLSDLILDVINELGPDNFSFRSSATQNLVFDREQIRFTIRELLENSLKFKSDSSLVRVEWNGNELSIKNKQAFFGQIESLPIEVFSPPVSDSQERRGLGVGLFLCKEYCRMNQAKLNCSIDSEGFFKAQIFFRF